MTKEDTIEEWEVKIDYPTPLEYFGCISRRCDSCSWESSREIGGVQETFRRVMYLKTLIKFSGVKRRVNHIKRDWERYAKKRSIKKWSYTDD